MATYTDINLALISNPISGDIGTLVDNDAVKRSLVHLMLRQKWDVPFEPNAHSYLNDYLFEPTGNITTLNIKSTIQWLIDQYEPRILVKNIDVALNPAENAYIITIEFLIKNILKEGIVNFTLSRIR